MILLNPFLPLWNQPKSARGPAGNRSLEEGKRLGRIKNVKAFSDGHGNLLFNRFLAFSSSVTLRKQEALTTTPLWQLLNTLTTLERSKSKGQGSIPG